MRRFRSILRFPVFRLLSFAALAGTGLLWWPGEESPRPTAAPEAAATAPIGLLEGTFSVDGNGAATYEIELEVPPGTNGVQPDLTLTYNGQRDNGFLGMGWALNGIEAVARCNATQASNGFTAPVSYDSRDRFCMASMPLLAVNGEYGYDGTEYRTARDTWTKVVSHGRCGQGPCWFSAQNKDGSVLRFGFTTGSSGSRILAAGRTDGAVRVWGLDRYTDLNGNYTAVSYVNNATTGEYYPSRIDYTGNERTGFAPQRSVVLVAGPRTDRIQGYSGGSPYQTFSRLTNIQTFVGNQMVKNYVIDYTYGSATKRSRIRSIQDCANDSGSADSCFPATTFDMSDPGNGFSKGSVISTGQSVSSLIGLMPMDVNGDGRTDMVQAWSGSGTLNLITYLSTGQSLGSGRNQSMGVSNGDLGVIGMDVNGDGLGDVVMPVKNGSSLDLRAFLSNGTGFGTDVTTRTGQSNSHLSFAPADVNADGRQDLVQVVDQSGKVRFITYLASGSGGFEAGVVTNTDRTTANHGFLPLDVNGDGRVDIVQPQSSGSLQFLVYLSDGRGFGPATAVSSGRNPSKLEILAGDVNGDQKADLLLANLDGSTVELTPYLGTGTTFRSVFSVSLQGGDSNLGIYTANLNGDGREDFYQAVKVSNTVRLQPYFSTGDRFTKGTEFNTQLASETLGFQGMDLNGDGKQDLLDPQDKSGKVSFSLVLSNTGQPDLIDKVTNGFNGQVIVTHKPMTDSSVYTRGSGAQYPVFDVQMALPIVSRYVNTDGRGASYTFDYQYTQALFGYNGMGWLGFRTVKMAQTSNGRFSEVTYDQTWPRNGLVVRNAIHDSKGVMLGGTDLVYEDKASAALQAKGIHQFVRTSESYSAFDNQSGGARLYTLKKNYGYDSFANVNQIADLGQPGITTDDRYFCTRFSNDTASWTIGYLAQQMATTTEAGCQAFLAATNPVWDPAVDVQWEKKEYDARRNVTASSTWDDSHNAWVTVRATFDDYGNHVTTTDAAGKTTDFTFDAAYHTFPVKVVSPPNQTGVRLTDTFEYEPGFGQQTKNTDPNGNVFRWEIDVFGRVVREYSPNPSGTTVLVRQMSWGQDANGYYSQESSRHAWESENVADWTWQKTYVDGMLRQYRDEERGATAATAVVDAIQFNVDGQVSHTSVPYFANQTPQWITTTYDVYNRPLTSTQPDGTVQKFDYQLGTLKVYTTDAFGTPEARTEIVQFDAFGQVISRALGNGEVYRYTYTILGQVESINAVPDRRSVTFTYDSVGRLRSMSSGDTGKTTYDFNDKDQMVGQTDADNNSIAYTYDDLGRILTATSRTTAGTNTINYTYDGSTSNGRGNLTRVDMNQAPLGDYSYVFGYDADSQTRVVKVTLGGDTYGYGMEYNPLGQVTGEIYPDGTKLIVGYGADTNPSTFALQKGAAAPETYITYSDYNPYGEPLTTRYKNGVEMVRTFYPNDVRTGKLKTITARRTGGSPATLYSREMLWNRLDFVTEVKDLLAPAQNQTFTYDAKNLGFLTKAQGGYGTENYTYDRVGNRLSHNGVNYTYSTGSDRLSAFGPNTSMAWNTNGTLKSMSDSRQTFSFTYNASGKLLRVDKQGTTQPALFAYDFTGNRIFEQPVGQSTKLYGISSDYEIADYGGGRRIATRYIDGVFGREVAITAPAGSNSLALLSHNHRMAARLYDQGDGLGSAARSAFHAALAVATDPEVVQAAEQAGLAGLCLAMLVAVGLLWRRPRRGGGTLYMRQYPVLARVVPLVVAALLLEVAVPAEAALTPGANGPGNPTDGTLYFVQDLVGSTVSVTDAAGQETAAVGYLPFGLVDQNNSRGTDNFRPKFSGNSYDPTTGLYYFSQRDYDPLIGRFTTPDPAAQYINPYLLGANNPTSQVDPTGEFAFLAVIIIGAVIGAYMGAAAVNHDYNPANWDWKSGKTYAGLFGGAIIGAVGGALVEVAATAGVAAGIAAAVLVGAGENAAFTAMGGGSAKDILISAAEGAAFGFLFGGAGAALGRLGRGAGRGAGRAGRAGGEALSEAAEGGETAAARTLRSSCSSFLPGEEVLTADGATKPIETLAVGEKIQGYEQDKDSPGTFPVAATLTGETEQVTTVTTASGAVIEATPNHQFRAHDMGWIAAEDLHPGLQLIDPTGKPVAIRSVETRPLGHSSPVYNLSVETAESYYVSADHVLVHNVHSLCLVAKGKRRPGWRTTVKNTVFQRQIIKSGKFKGRIQSAVSKQRYLRTHKVGVGTKGRRVTIWQLDHIVPYRDLLWAASKSKKTITWKNMIEISNYAANLRYITMSENVSHAFEPSMSVGRKGAIAILKKLGYWK